MDFYNSDWVSFDEAGLFLIESAENDFNIMMAQIGVQEYAEAKNGTAVMESWDDVKGKARDLKDKLVDWIKKVKDKILSVWDKAMGWFNEKIDKFHRNIGDKRLKKLPAKVDKLKDKVYGRTFEYPHFDQTLENGGECFSAIEKYSKDVEDVLNNITDKDTAKEKLKSLDAKLRSDFKIGADSADSAIKHAIKKEITGDEVNMDKAYIRANIKDMINNTADYSKMQRKLKAHMKSVSKKFDESIKTLKKDGRDNEDFSMVFGVAAPYVKKAHHYFSAASSAILSATRAKMLKEMSIIIKLTVTFGKDRDDSTSTSPTTESATFQSEIANLFDFKI